MANPPRFSVTKLVIWKDTGYQRNAYIVPGKTDTLPNPTGTFNFTDEPACPATTDIFHAINLYSVYLQLWEISYIKITFETTPDPITFYAWVDDVIPLNKLNTRIEYTIDLWRSYLSKAKFSYGLVMNRPRAMVDPMQNCSYRYRRAGDFISLIPSVPGAELNWLIFAYVKESNQRTLLRTCFLPIDKSDIKASYYVQIGTVNAKCPSLEGMLTGTFPDDMGISASQIVSAFISPLPPIEIEKIEGTTIYPKVRLSSDTETNTINFDDTRTKKVISMSWDSLASKPFKVSYSDGTVDSYSTYQGHYDNLNGIRAGTNIECTGVHYKIKLRDLMATAITDYVYMDGDVVTFTGVTNSRTVNLTVKPGESYRVSGILVFSVSYPEKTTHEYTYNTESGGWDDVYICSDEPIKGVLTTSTSVTTSYSIAVEKPNSGNDYGYIYTSAQLFTSYPVQVGMKTTDTSEVVITDMSGIPLGSSPWGYELGDGTVRTVISSTSVYLQYRFDGTDSFSEGVEFTIPCPAVDIASNSWSDYVYSGQRAYDQEQRRIASQQALIQGVSSALTGGFSNAVFASIGQRKGGSAVPGKIGIASVGLGAVTSGVEYGLALYHNGQLQKAEDQLQTKQFDSLIATGSGWDWLWYGRSPGVITLVPDDYSLNRFNADIEWNGISCSEPTSDITPLINQGGPLRISNAIVGGEIPVQARNYISNLLERGVYIKN